MENLLKILFVEDVIHDAELIWREIEKSKISFTKIRVENRADYLKGIENFKPDIIISDYSLPKFDGMSALKLRNENVPSIPFILVTGSINEEIAVECMKAGADDYILKETYPVLDRQLSIQLIKVKFSEIKTIQRMNCTKLSSDSRRHSQLLMSETGNSIFQQKQYGFLMRL
jgi:CheY-like chemotaxis protein